MEPLYSTTHSVAGTSIALAGTITHLSTNLTIFIRDVRDARVDIEDISLELHSLKMILELIASDSTGPLPPTLETQLKGILAKCTQLVRDIDECIQQPVGSRFQKGVRWVAVGRSDMVKLKLTLEAYKTTLDLLLHMISQTKLHEVNDATKEIKVSTETLKQTTEAVKIDTSKILDAIAELRAIICTASAEHYAEAFMLQRYLDELATYAESVIDTSIKWSDSEAKPENVEHDRAMSHSEHLKDECADQSRSSSPLSQQGRAPAMVKC
ncbi:hypothetical protein QQX98_012698 [Neonectria punicea]|uniref:Azaphilone pigments biosynthesis cluster protein L N-terminal domain-containing protein n=1 Tax=Neonectria punicea TaxID=979145 RepID=A0ABR1GIC9_9HYPO